MTPEEAKAVFAKAECLYSKKDIDASLDRMAAAITNKLKDENPLLICVLKGGIVALGELLVRLNFPLQIDYLHASRYRGKTIGGDLHWLAKPTVSLKNRTLLIVDDVLDTGVTLKIIVDYCKAEDAKAVYTAALVDKKEARLPQGLPTADFIGLTLPNRYIVGYGMDCNEYWRNAPGIYAIDVDNS